jgi:hypothetical protein
MILRIEFPETKSPNFRRVLSICRKIKSFKETKENDAPLYSIEFDEDKIFSAEAIRDYVQHWKGTAYYLDGELISRGRAYRMIWDYALEQYKRAKDAQPIPPGKEWKDENGFKDRQFSKHIVPVERSREVFGVSIEAQIPK